LLGTEASRISKHTSKPTQEFAAKIEDSDPYDYEMKKTPGKGKCVFLNGNTCAIYALRPLICRFYPFQLRIRKDRKYHFLQAKDCPGIGKGQELQKDFFENLFGEAQRSLGKAIRQ
jgi:Fe-S-cluster containining protein